MDVDPADVLPDIRDGLTRLERIILVTLAECQEELGGRPVPTVMLYGRVIERVDLAPARVHALLDRLGVSHRVR